VPVRKDELVRIKVVRQAPDFERQFIELHHFATRPSSGNFVKAADYPTRLDILFRGQSEDVTGQIINAFKVGILPRVKEYLPKRDELVAAALTIFSETMKRLASGGGP